MSGDAFICSFFAKLYSVYKDQRMEWLWIPHRIHILSPRSNSPNTKLNEMKTKLHLNSIPYEKDQLYGHRYDSVQCQYFPWAILPHNTMAILNNQDDDSTGKYSSAVIIIFFNWKLRRNVCLAIRDLLITRISVSTFKIYISISIMVIWYCMKYCFGRRVNYLLLFEHTNWMFSVYHLSQFIRVLNNEFDGRPNNSLIMNYRELNHLFNIKSFWEYFPFPQILNWLAINIEFITIQPNAI